MTVTQYDPKAGASAFAALKTTLEQIPSADVASPLWDVQKAAIGALTLVPFLLLPKTKARFASLSKSFDPTTLGLLEQAALAAWYAQNELLSEEAISDEQRVPAATVEAASKLKARMFRLCEFLFDDDPVIAAELASIKSGQGYQDLANDLTRLARLYDQQKDALESAPKHYDAGDAAAARKMAEQILISLVSAENVTRTGRDLRDRAWTYLADVYDEVCAAGSFLYRDTDDAERFAVKLVSTARPSRGRSRKSTPPPAPVATPTPAPVIPGNAAQPPTSEVTHAAST